MAKVRVQNQTSYRLVVPRPLNLRLTAGQARVLDIIDVDRTFNDPRIVALVDGGQLKLTLLEDDTPDSGATLPFYTDAQMPDATQNAGMMVYNTTQQLVLYSTSIQWVAVESVPTFNSAPAPATLPPGYLIWEKDTQTLLYNGGSAWMRTTANGVDARPGHLFPTPTSVPAGTILMDTDTKQLRVSDGNRWLYPSYANEYSSYSSLPLPTNVPFGNLAFVSDTQSLFLRQGGSWVSTAAQLRFYATYGDLPDSSTYGNDERGVVAYINDDHAVVVWDGKYWRYMTQMRDYKPGDIPDPSNYADGHMILNGDVYQPLIAWSGDWKGITPVARPYVAGARPANADCKEGTMIWNSTSNKVNFNIGGRWVDASGVVDP